MKLTIVAATGGIGRQLVAQALAAGHDVTAVARDPRGLDGSVRGRAIDLAAPDHAALEAAIAGADAVLSGLGARSAAEVGVVSAGTGALVQAMTTTNVRRLVVVSAAPIGTVASPGRPSPPRHDPGDGFVTRHLLAPMIKAVLRTTYADLAVMEDGVRASGLAWTVVRPPRLTHGPHTGGYRTAIGQNVRGGLWVARADVADLMLRVLAQPATIGQTVGIAR